MQRLLDTLSRQGHNGRHTEQAARGMHVPHPVWTVSSRTPWRVAVPCAQSARIHKGKS